MSIVALLAVPGAALADDVNCPPNLGSVTIDGNVLVAAPCRLDGTTVNGTVVLYSGGSLVARGATIVGNIQAKRADFIDVDQSDVNGDVQLDEMVGDVARLGRSRIGGSVQLYTNRSRVEVIDNDVGGDVQAVSNVGGVIIADNVVDGNLQCSSNDPAPAGGNNRVLGNLEGQCVALRPEVGPTPVPPPSAPGTGSSGGGGSLGLIGWLFMLVARVVRSPTRYGWPTRD